MGLCSRCSCPYEDGATNCPVCGAPANEAPVQPIWVTQSANLPPADSLEDSFLDDSFLEDSFETKTDPGESPSDYRKNPDHSVFDSPEGDVFDEASDFASLLYANMSPKLKKFIIITVVTTLLSIIPLIYVACSHQADTSSGSSQSASATTIIP